MNAQTKKFKIQIWFDSASAKVELGTAFVYANTETEALELARAHTEYKVSGVDNVDWQVRERVRAYAV